MKRRKQILAVILAGVMTVPMAIPAQAAEIQDSVIEEASGEYIPVEVQDESEKAVQNDSQAGADDIIVEENSEAEVEVTGNAAEAQEKIHLSFEENLTDSTAVHTVTAKSGDGSEKQAVYTEGVKSGTKAIKFDGSTYLDMGTTPDLTPSAMTASFWVKPDNSMGDGEQVFIWNKNEWYTDGWYLASQKNKPLIISLGPANKDRQPYCFSISGDRDTFFPAGEWTQITLTYDSTTKEAFVYRNGVVQNLDQDYAIDEQSGATGIIGENNTFQKSLGYNGSIYKGSFLSGVAMDEFFVKDYAMSQKEILTAFGEFPEFAEAALQDDHDSLTLPETVYSDLTLPAEGKNGSSITWETSAADIMTADGKIVTTEGGAVTLTATLTMDGYEGEALNKDFNITVRKPNYINNEMDKVTLYDEYLVNAENKEIDYLLSMSSEKFLYEFYKVSGLAPTTDSGYGGWEAGSGANFRGHFFGHYMSALSQEYLSCKDEAIKEALMVQIEDAVNGLKVYQDAYAVKHPDSAGYVSPFPEAALDRADSGQNPTDIVYVPYYNLHKVLAGLIDVSRNIQGEVGQKALQIASRFGDHLYNRSQNWAGETALKVEYGGMNEALYDLYYITGNEHYRKVAEKFDEISLFDQLANNQDVLSGKHANTTIPKLIGAVKRYQVMEKMGTLTDKEDHYLKAAENFWDIVVNHHSYITGGNSQSEHFRNPDSQGANADNVNCETCNTYNMLKLSRALFQITGDKKYMDYYENTYINAILSSQNPETGMTMYFQPMAPGYYKLYSSAYDSFWCCTGTGVENFTKLGDTVYLQEDGKFYVNMFFSSTYDDGSLRLTQAAQIPNSDVVTFNVEQTDGRTIYVRKPEWLASETVIKINGSEANVREEGGYFAVNPSAGDTVEFKFPMKVTYEATPDKPNMLAFKYGPVALSCGLGTKDMDKRQGAGIIVYAPVLDRTAVTTINLADSTVDEWKANISENLVRIEDSADGQVQFALEGTDQDENLIYTPHYKRYNERYGLYMYFAEPDSAELQAQILENKESLRDKEASSAYLTNFDNNNIEATYNNKFENSDVGSYNGRQYRDAKSGGWFSYEMPFKEGDKNYLCLTYTGADRGRSFDIYLNGEKFVTETINPDGQAVTSDGFYTVKREVPDKYLTGDALAIKFQSTGGLVGGVYGIAITTDYDTDPSLKSLTASTGTWDKKFKPEEKEYTLTVSKDTENVKLTATPRKESGLVYEGETLFDDTKPRTILLQQDTTDVILNTKAQDHIAVTQYVIHIIKSDNITPKPDPEPGPNPDPGPNPSPDPTPDPTPAPDDGKVVVTPETEDKGNGKVEVTIPDVSTDKPDEKKDVTVELPKDDLQNTIQNSKDKEININITIPDSITNSENVNLEELKLPKEVFQTAKEEKKDITVTVTDSKDNTYSWSFSGKDVDEGKLADVNLKLETRKVSDDEQLNDKLHADESGIVIDFAHKGELPAEASVTIDAEALGFNPGDKVTLYYFNEETGELEAQGKSYKVDKYGKIKVEVDHCSKYMVKKTTAIKVAKMTGVKTTVSATAVKVSWKKNPDATGYRVYRYNTGKKKYEKIADVKGTSYTDRGLKSATAYRYAVRTYVTASKTYYSPYTGNLKALTKPAAPASVKAKRTSKVSAKSTAAISFKKVDRASTYRIYKYNKKTKKYAIAYRVVKNKLYQYNSKTKKYKKVNNVKVKNGVITCSLKNLNLKSEKSQKYVVKATVSKSGYKTQYSANSKAVTIK